MAIDPLLGTTLERRFRVVQRIGHGGMGAVYLAEHLTLPRRFAIKVLGQGFSERPEFVERFFREARAASTIDHPNVVEVVDTGALPDGRAYYVMEHLQGEDLARTLRTQGRLPWPRVRHIALQICDVLERAHEHGIVHRDLKPANCFRITRRGDPDFIKLLDFGIAKLLDDHPLTGTGELLGTTQYMAPEQAAGDDIDHRVDIYSLGTMLYQLLTGVHPYPGRNDVQMLYALVHHTPTPLRAAAPAAGLPAELDDIVARAMHRDRAARFPSMRALAEALATVPPEPLHDPEPARRDETSFESQVTRVGRGAARPPPNTSPLNPTRAAPVPVEPDVAAPASESPANAPRVRAAVWPLAALALAAAAVVSLTWPEARPAATVDVRAPAVERVVDQPPRPDAPTTAPTSSPPAPSLQARSHTPPDPTPELAAPPPAATPRTEDPSGSATAAITVAAAPGSGRRSARPSAAATPRPADHRDIDARVQKIRRKIEATCHSRLTAESVVVDLEIQASTGGLRQRRVAPPHDRTSVRGCIEGLFDAERFPSFTGGDYARQLTIEIQPAS